MHFWAKERKLTASGEPTETFQALLNEAAPGTDLR